jgi:betaine-aldehyde dehydrogenase
MIFKPAEPRIGKISLTGQVATGKAVMADAADGLRHVTLELGGLAAGLFTRDLMRHIG